VTSSPPRSRSSVTPMQRSVPIYWSSDLPDTVVEAVSHHHAPRICAERNPGSVMVVCGAISLMHEAGDAAVPRSEAP